MFRKASKVLGPINTAINVIQLCLLGKRALQSEQGQKAVKKTVEIGKDVGRAGIEATGSACRQAARTVECIGTKIESARKKSEPDTVEPETVDKPKDCCGKD